MAPVSSEELARAALERYHVDAEFHARVILATHAAAVLDLSSGSDPYIIAAIAIMCADVDVATGEYKGDWPIRRSPEPPTISPALLAALQGQPIAVPRRVMDNLRDAQYWDDLGGGC